MYTNQHTDRFTNWMAKVDEALIKKCGMDSADLPDCDYYTEFENGTSPSGMARIAIRTAGSY